MSRLSLYLAHSCILYLLLTFFSIDVFGQATLIISSDIKSVINSSEIPVKFEFNQDVTGFTADDVEITNGIIVANSLTGSNKVYNLKVTPTAVLPVSIFVQGGEVNAPGNVKAGLHIPTFSPSDGATNIAVNSNFSISFAKPMLKGSGLIKIIKAGTTTNINVTDASVVLSADKKTVTINPPNDLTANTDYNIQIDGTAFNDESANINYAGITNGTTWNFKTAAAAVQQAFIFSSPTNAADPANITVCEGEEVIFSASPPASAGTTYQFKKDGNNFGTSSAASTLKTTNLQNGNQITVTITSSGGSATSAPIRVTVKPKPVISNILPTQRNYTPADAEVQLKANLNGTESNSVEFTGPGVISRVENNVIKYFFDPKIARNGQNIIKATASVNGCQTEQTITITVNTTGDIFTNLDDQFCSSDRPRTLIIRQEVRNQLTAEGNYAEALVYLDLKSEIFKWEPIDDPNNVFNPANADYNTPAFGGTNLIGIQIRRISDNQFMGIRFQETNVIQTPNVDFQEINNNDSYCKSDVKFIRLKGIIDGAEDNSGIFRIKRKGDEFITDNTNFNNGIFNPSSFNAGIYEISYEKANGVSDKTCTGKKTKEVTIIDPPVDDFTVADLCLGNNTSFKILFSANEELKYSWDFGDGFVLQEGTGAIPDTIHNGITSGTYENPRHRFLIPNTYEVKLSVTSAQGCTKTLSKNITISPIPVAKLYVKNVCQGEFTAFFPDSSNISVGTIQKWEWNFGDNDSLVMGSGNIAVDTHNDKTRGTFKNPEHKYDNIGSYTVTLIIQSNSGCTDTLRRIVNIFPQVNIFPYREDFEANGSNGWVSGGTNSSWHFGEPAGLNPEFSSIKQAASGVNAWITRDDSTYNNNERSFVESPCFDFTTLQRPMIVFNLAYVTDAELDGAVLQVTDDDGLTWKVVGQKDEGINWYNTSFIVSNPGSARLLNDQFGWSGTEPMWKEARYTLDDYKGKTSVRFRFTFASNNENTPGRLLDGFAFDDVFIGERNKTILLEHFTHAPSSLPDSEVRINDEAIDQIITQSFPDETVVLRYHAEAFGKDDDQINKRNPADPSARALLYGVSALPWTAIDGYNVLNNDLEPKVIPFIKNTSSENLGLKQYNRRSLVQSPFAISISLPNTPQSTLPVTAEITKTDIVTGPFVIQLALIEKSVSENNHLFKNVVRKLLPNAAGTRIDDPAWAQGTSKSVTVSFAPANDATLADMMGDSDDFGIVIFIQDEQTKEVYQAAYDSIPKGLIESLVTGIEDINTANVLVFPNPASDEVHINFPEKITQDFELTIFDAYGKILDVHLIERGSSDFNLNTGGYSNGFYILEARQRGNRTGIRKKLVIAK